MLVRSFPRALLRTAIKPAVLSTTSARWVHYRRQQQQHNTDPPWSTATFPTAAVLGLGALGLATAAGSSFFTSSETTSSCAAGDTGVSSSSSSSSSSSEEQFFSRAEVAKHTTPETGIWVTYKDGVYDITQFVEQHPGGAKRILLAAGSSVDPFWKLYQQHFTNKVQDILPPLRIGTLHPDEERIIDTSDPYANDPERHPALVVRKQKPFNAESPLTFMCENYLTPNELWYCRHHHPVPVVDPATFQLSVKNQSTAMTSKEEDVLTFNLLQNLTLKDIKNNYKKHQVIATMQCGGNRRGGLNANGKTQGTAWDVGAISTAKWGGARLRDVLADVAGIKTLEDAEKQGIKHVHFLPLDPPYDSSIPIEKALAEYGDVLLAYEMNDVTLPAEHGYPIRMVVPGTIGARNVKWVNSIRLSSEEAESVWQRGVQYKGFSPNVKKFDKSVDPSQVVSCQEMPVQSAVIVYDQNIDQDDTDMDISGYAWSGGGRSIVRVDVTTDGGETWTTADLGEGKDQSPGRAWGWTLWTAKMKVPDGLKVGDTFNIACKAVDSSYNQQPEKIGTVWNLRGILNNSWHKVEIKCVKEEDY